MKRKTAWTLCLATSLVLSLGALARVGDPASPTLTEKRFQATQLAAFSPVDPDLARPWIAPGMRRRGGLLALARGASRLGKSLGGAS